MGRDSVINANDDVSASQMLFVYITIDYRRLRILSLFATMQIAFSLKYRLEMNQLQLV